MDLIFKAKSAGFFFYCFHCVLSLLQVNSVQLLPNHHITLTLEVGDLIRFLREERRHIIF